jgi:hypothetical protein
MWIDSTGKDRARSQFKALGAPLDRVFGPYDPENRGAAVDLADDRWLEIVAELTYAERPCWVIVDGHGVGQGDSMGHALDAMAGIARDVGCAATFLCGQAGRESLALIAGKVATVMVLDRWGSSSEDMRFRVVESSFGKHPSSLRLKFEAGIPEVVARSLEKPRTTVGRAVTYLEERLTHGPRPAIQLIGGAKSEGISKRSLERAKRRLRVRAYQKSGRWWWASA